MNIFEPGDYINDIGTVDSNHCGLPWPVNLNGDTYYGVVKILNQNILCDAKTGKILSNAELNKRINKKEFDYNKRFQNNTGRRHPH